jgi:hypothetical protein
MSNPSGSPVTDTVDLDAHEAIARAAWRGPWQWYGNTKTHSVYLASAHSGRRFVMDFDRWGMTGAQPRFQVDHRMVRLSELAATESPLGPKFEVPYRRNFAGIGHPDATHIAANDPTTTLALIARIRELEHALTVLAWADPPTPEKVLAGRLIANRGITR